MLNSTLKRNVFNCFYKGMPRGGGIGNILRMFVPFFKRQDIPPSVHLQENIGGNAPQPSFEAFDQEIYEPNHQRASSKLDVHDQSDQIQPKSHAHDSENASLKHTDHVVRLLHETCRQNFPFLIHYPSGTFNYEPSGENGVLYAMCEWLIHGRY